MTPRDPAVTERRERVWEMASAGMTRAEIAREMGMSKEAVSGDLRQHAERFGLVVPPAPSKRAGVPRLSASGMSRREIADRLGMSPECVASHLYLARRKQHGRDHVKTVPVSEGCAA
jgi:DNA-binding CsgD family transcriptional regulator